MKHRDYLKNLLNRTPVAQLGPLMSLLGVCFSPFDEYNNNAFSFQVNDLIVCYRGKYTLSYYCVLVDIVLDHQHSQGGMSVSINEHTHLLSPGAVILVFLGFKL